MKRHEQAIQMALADHLRARAAAGTYWFHPANGGARTAFEGAILKACGVRAGTHKGRVSPTQAQAHEELRAAGATVAVATGIDDALAQLEAWQLLRGQTQ
jgi:hypothetical protein